MGDLKKAVFLVLVSLLVATPNVASGQPSAPPPQAAPTPRFRHRTMAFLARNCDAFVGRAIVSDVLIERCVPPLADQKQVYYLSVYEPSTRVHAGRPSDSPFFIVASPEFGRVLAERRDLSDYHRATLFLVMHDIGASPCTNVGHVIRAAFVDDHGRPIETLRDAEACDYYGV